MAERSKVEKSDWFPKKKNPCQANLQAARCISRNIKKSTFLQIFWKIVDSLLNGFKLTRNHFYAEPSSFIKKNECKIFKFLSIT